MERDFFFALELDAHTNPYFAHSLVKKYFCYTVSRSGACENCRSCEPYVRAAFVFKDKPKSPVGLIIWKLKDEASKYVDENHIPMSETEYGDNAFGSLLEELNEGTTKKSRKQSSTRTNQEPG